MSSYDDAMHLSPHDLDMMTPDERALVVGQATALRRLKALVLSAEAAERGGLVEEAIVWLDDYGVGTSVKSMPKGGYVLSGNRRVSWVDAEQAVVDPLALDVEMFDVDKHR